MTSPRRFMPHWYYLNTVLPRKVLATVLSFYSKFTHVSQDHKHGVTSQRFLLRSFNVVQVRSGSDRFYIGVVANWSSVTRVCRESVIVIQVKTKTQYTDQGSAQASIRIMYLIPTRTITFNRVIYSSIGCSLICTYNLHSSPENLPIYRVRLH